jgi:hypothetical protein
LHYRSHQSLFECEERHLKNRSNGNTYIELSKILNQRLPISIGQPEFFLFVLVIDVAFHVQIGIDVGGNANALLHQIRNDLVQVWIPEIV